MLYSTGAANTNGGLHSHATLLVIAVILALAANLVTRYFPDAPIGTVLTFKSSSAIPHHERLAKNSLQWYPPVQQFTFSVSVIASQDPTPTELSLVAHPEDPLYNRPPPTV